MLILIALTLVAALGVAVLSKGRKIGLSLVLVASAVAMIWWDNFSTPEKWIFWILFIGGLIYTSRGSYSRGARTGAGLAVLIITALLATTWNIMHDNLSQAAKPETIEVTRKVIAATTDADGNTADVPIVETGDTVTDESSTTDPAIPATVECDRSGTFAEMEVCIDKSANKAEIIKFLNANEVGILGNNEAGTTWDRIKAFPADLDSRVILVLNAPDVSEAEIRAEATKTMGKLAERAKIVRRDGVVLINSYTDSASGKVLSYADGRKQIRTITTYADNGKEAILRAYNGQGMLGGCLNGSKGVVIKEKVRVETRVETRTVTKTVNTNSTSTVSAPAVTTTATSTETVPGPTTTVAGPGGTATITAPPVTSTATVTQPPLPGKTVTYTPPVETRTATSTTTASPEPPPPGATTTVTATVPGPTATVVGPGATVTATATTTATATVTTGSTSTTTVPGPTTTVTGPGGTATITAPPVTTTVTVTPPPLPGKTVTYTPPVETRTSTVTAPAEPGPTVTHTITVTATPTNTGDPNNP